MCGQIVMGTVCQRHGGKTAQSLEFVLGTGMAPSFSPFPLHFLTFPAEALAIPSAAELCVFTLCIQLKHGSKETFHQTINALASPTESVCNYLFCVWGSSLYT